MSFMGMIIVGIGLFAVFFLLCFSIGWVFYKTAKDFEE